MVIIIIIIIIFIIIIIIIFPIFFQISQTTEERNHLKHELKNSRRTLRDRELHLLGLQQNEQLLQQQYQQLQAEYQRFQQQQPIRSELKTVRAYVSLVLDTQYNIKYCYWMGNVLWQESGVSYHIV